MNYIHTHFSVFCHSFANVHVPPVNFALACKTFVFLCEPFPRKSYIFASDECTVSRETEKVLVMVHFSAFCILEEIQKFC